MDTRALARLGLKPNDIAVFKAIAELGKTKTGAIMQASGIGSSQTYLSLGRLIKRGLVSYQVRNNVRYYQAEVPDTLIEDARTTISALEEVKREIVRAPTTSARNFVNTFETTDGFKKALLRHVDLVGRGETLSIIGFSSRVSNQRELRAFLTRCNAIAESKRCTMRIILDEKFRSNLSELRGPRYVVRYLPASYFTPSALNICKREVVLSVWGDNPIAISITEPTVIKSFLINFEAQWESAKK